MNRHHHAEAAMSRRSHPRRPYCGNVVVGLCLTDPGLRWPVVVQDTAITGHEPTVRGGPTCDAQDRHRGLSRFGSDDVGGMS
jgi:hypothetical protein